MTAATGPYEAVWAHPTGDSTAARLALTAARVGYDGIVIRNAHELDDGPSLEEVAHAFGIDVIDGIELVGEMPDAVSGLVPHRRELATVLAIRGGSVAMNRFAVEQRRADVLTDPLGADRHAIDAGIVKTAREHDVAIEVNLGPVRGEAGGTRVRYLDRLRELWRVIDHHDAPYVVSTTPRSHLDVVDPRGVVALCDAVGLEAEAMEAGRARWRAIADRHRDGEAFMTAAGQGRTDEADPG